MHINPDESIYSHCVDISGSNDYHCGSSVVSSVEIQRNPGCDVKRLETEFFKTGTQ